MAIAKDLIVLGKTRHIGDVYAGTIYAESFVKNGSSADYVLLGDGTHIALSTFAVSSHTHSIKINGTTHSVGTSLVDLGSYLPSAGGTLTGNVTYDNEKVTNYKETRKKANGGGWAYNAIRFIGYDSNDFFHIGVYGNNNDLTYGYIGVNEYNGNNLRISSTGVSWGTNEILHAGNYTNYTNQYVKLDAGAAEQSIKSSITTPTKGIINLWMNGGDKEAFLGFSNGTTEKYLGGIGFKSQNDHDIYLKRTSDNTTSSVQYYQMLHTGNIGFVYSDSKFTIDPRSRRITSIKTDSAWNAQVYSTNGYMDAIILSFKIGQTGKQIAIGLDSVPITNASYETIDYCWKFDSTNCYISENGNIRLNCGVYNAADEFRIEYFNSRIKYYKNGILKRNVNRSISGKLYFDSSFYKDGNIYDLTFTLGSMSNNIEIIDLR